MSDAMTEHAAQIAEFTVAKLDVAPGDVVVVRAPTEWGAETFRTLGEHLKAWAEAEDVDLRWLVVAADVEPQVLHTLSPEDLERAGAGGWPHEQT